MKRLDILAFFMLCFSLAACHKENEMAVNPSNLLPIKGTVSVSNQLGVVEFNDDMQRWVINLGTHVVNPGAGIRTCMAIPYPDLPAQYKKYGTELLVVGTVDYTLDSMSDLTKRLSSRFSLSNYYLNAAPSPDNLWQDYDYIKIKLPDRVLFFSKNQPNMEPFGTWTTVNIPDLKVYGIGSGFYYRREESVSITIFDSISRFQNNLSDVVKTGNLPIAADAKSPGASLSWVFPNSLYFYTFGDDNNRPDCFFKIVKSESIPDSFARTYRIGATFRCVFNTKVNGMDTRMMGEGQLVTKIQFPK